MRQDTEALKGPLLGSCLLIRDCDAQKDKEKYCSGCTVGSVYLSPDPMGDAGVDALAKGIAKNTSLLYLALAFCGLKPKGAISILQSLAGHSRLMTLRFGQKYATQDLR